MRDKALAAVERHQMFKKGEGVLVALSGGADSVALLHFLCGIQNEWELTLGALHLNHMLRGEESERDEAFVRDLCGECGIPLTVERADVKEAARKAGESLEQCGRRLRYSFFEREASRTQAKVAVAHTASDNAETVLINLTRGTALRGLAGIPPVRDRIIRPLIGCTRDEIESYCLQNSLRWVDDSSNQSDRHTRNRIRRHVIPLLAQENPSFTEKLTHLCRTLRDDADYLDALAVEAREGITRPDGSLASKGFLALAPALQGRVLAGLLRGAGILAGGELINGMRAMISAGKGSRQVGRGMTFSCTSEGFYLKAQPKEQGHFSVSVDVSSLEDKPEEIEVFPGKKAALSLRRKNAQNQNNVKELQIKGVTSCLNRLDCDKIENVVTLRGRLPGDKLRPVGRGCTKTLKNLFQENSVDLVGRSQRIVAADDEGVLWVEGFGPDERAAVTDETTRILTIETAAEDDL